MDFTKLWNRVKGASLCCSCLLILVSCIIFSIIVIRHKDGIRVEGIRMTYLDPCLEADILKYIGYAAVILVVIHLVVLIVYQIQSGLQKKHNGAFSISEPIYQIVDFWECSGRD